MNSTMMVNQPEWSSKPAWKLPGWAEPLVSISLMPAGCLNRHETVC